MTVVRGRRTVISIRGEDAEYLMPALREVEVERMKKEWEKLHEGTRGRIMRPNEHGKVIPARAYVCEWCGAEVGPEDHVVHKGIKIYYCQDKPLCERELGIIRLGIGPACRRGV